MFPTKLTQPQREGIFDLLLLGMYADGAIRLAENERIYDLISPFGWESYQDAREYSDAATARARKASENAENGSVFLADINARLGDDEVRKLALALLAQLIESDNAAAESEAEFFQTAKTAFGV